MARRAQFSPFLSSTTASLTVNRYFRLMALATAELLCTTAISAYAIYLNVTASPVQPWKGSADTHFGYYSQIGQFSAVEWRMDSVHECGFSRAQPVELGVLRFLLLWILWIRRRSTETLSYG